MDAIEFLSQQHHDLRDVFEQVEITSGDERRRHFDSLARLLEQHTRLEERIFYPAARASRTKEVVDRGIGEHEDMLHRVETLRRMDQDTAEFRERLRELRILLHSHLGREEEELFPRARTWLGLRKLRELGDALGEEARSRPGPAGAGREPGTDRPWSH